MNVLVPFGALSNPQGTTGSLQIGNSSSLGTGPVALSNGVFQANNAVTLTNPLSLTGGPLPLALAGSPITIANPAALTGNATLSVNNTTTFNSDLAGAVGLTLTNQPVVAGTTTYTGTGNLVFTAPVSYSGPTTVGAGTLTLSGNGALTQTANTNAVQTISYHQGRQRHLHADLQRPDLERHHLQHDAGHHGQPQHPGRPHQAADQPRRRQRRRDRAGQQRRQQPVVPGDVPGHPGRIASTAHDDQHRRR